MKTIYNTTIRQFSQILKDDRFIGSLPKFIRVKQKNKLINDFNSFRGKKDENDLSNEYYRTITYAKILKLTALQKSLMIMITKQGKQMFKDEFGLDYEKERMSLIDDKINKLTNIFKTTDSPVNDSFDFDKYIADLEGLMSAPGSLQNIYLYQLTGYEASIIENLTVKNNKDGRTE